MSASQPASRSKRTSSDCWSFDFAPNAVALDPDWGRHAIAGLNEVCHREAFLMAVPCVATLDFAGGSGLDGLLGTSLRIVASHAQQRRASRSDQFAIRRPAGGTS